LPRGAARLRLRSSNDRRPQEVHEKRYANRRFTCDSEDASGCEKSVGKG
jgi:hypothetical protein